jgi:glycolate dehydrogenase FAD-binding subunit
LNDHYPPFTEIFCPTEAGQLGPKIAQAVERSQPIYPFGGQTSGLYGARPEQPGIGVDLSGLNRLVDYPYRDLTITVEAGMTIGQLQATLAEKNQRLPVDLPQAHRATVGGAIACNPSGPRRFRHGTLRDFLLGFEAIDGQGRKFEGGGRVVKNAAGYNLSRLIVGSMGTLGLITQATFMVRPVPEKTTFLTAGLSDFHAVNSILVRLQQSETLPLVIQWLYGGAWVDLTAIEEMPPGGQLVIGYEGTALEVDWMSETLLDQWSGNKDILNGQVIESKAADELQERMIHFPVIEPDTDDAAGAWVFQIGLLPDRMAQLFGQLVELDPSCSIEAQAGNGIVHVRFDRPVESDFDIGMVNDSHAAPVSSTGESIENAALNKRFLDDRLRPIVERLDGRLTVVTYPPALRLEPTSVWGPASRRTELFKSIQKRFDPTGCLNPGRYI